MKRPRGLRADAVLAVAADALTAERRADVLGLHARTGMGAWVSGSPKRRRRARRAIAKARVAAVELMAAYEAAIGRWEWWDAAAGPGRILGYALRADGFPSIWSTDPVRDRLRDRRRFGLGI